MQRFIILSILFGALSFFVACEDNNDPVSGNSEPILSKQAADDIVSLEHKQSGDYEYQITIENITPVTGPGASQPLSPPIIATHSSNYKVFKIGHFASEELAAVAEDALNAGLINRLSDNHRVFDVQQIGAGPILPGNSATATITAKKHFTKVSLVAMLVNTNDGFAGMNAVRLPKHGSRTVYLRAYDAGSEKNTESFDHIPGPCCNSPLVRVPTHERIKYHKGILGIGDLDPAVYGWDEPVAKVTITRL